MTRVLALGRLSPAARAELAAALQARGAALTHCGLEDLVVDARVADCDVLLLASAELCLVNAGILAQGLGARVWPDPERLKVMGWGLEALLESRRCGFETPEFLLGSGLALEDALRRDARPALRSPLIRGGGGPGARGGVGRTELALLGVDGALLEVAFVGERAWWSCEGDPPQVARALLSRWRRRLRLPFGHVTLMGHEEDREPWVLRGDLTPPIGRAADATSALARLLLRAP